MSKQECWSKVDIKKLAKNLKQAFANPPDEFRPVPWLCYNSKLRGNEIFRSIDLMFEQGIRAFFIFPIYGMEIEYLSDEWFEVVKNTVAYCEKIGMMVWIYDDYNWPAGNCGGKLIQQHPEFNKKNAYCKAFDVAPGAKISKTIAGTIFRSSLLQDNVLKLVNVEFEKNTVTWVNNTGKEAKLLIPGYAECKNPGSNWVANKGCLWQKDNGLSCEYIDWSNSEAIDCFISMAYERYYQELKPYWNTVKGFMCDEPGFFGICHSEALLQEFEKRYGYSLKDNYEHLFIHINESSYQIRADYRRLAGEMLSGNIRKINEWCLRHGVDFTGHYLGEESPGQEVESQSDSWGVRKNMSIPGMDLLMLDSNYRPVPMTEHMFSDHFYVSSGLAITTKATAATARYTGSSRAFVEAYGVAPYWVSPTDHAAHTHWLTAMGINFINDNTLNISYEDFRKRSTGGKHFTMPWWDWYKDFVEFAGRCSLMAAVGKIPDGIGMVYPVITAQCAYPGNFGSAESEDSVICQKSTYLCQQTAEMLTRQHLAWEIVWEAHLKTGKIAGGKLQFADINLSALVIPGMHFIEKSVLDALEKFAISGGIVIFIGILPQIMIDDKGNIPGRISALLKLKNVHFVEFHSPDEWTVINNQVAALLEPHRDPIFKLYGVRLNDIMAIHRIEDGTDIFHFVNMSPEPAEITVDIATAMPLSLWHPDDGQAYSLETVKTDNCKRTRLTFAPWEGYFILTGNHAAEKAGKFPLRHLAGGTGLFHSGHIPPEKRPLTVDNFKALNTLWNFKTEKPNMKPLIPQVLINETEILSGEKLSNETAVQKWLNTEKNMIPVELDPVKNPFFWVKTVFEARYIPDNLAVVVDGENYADIYCNGKKLTNGESAVLWDFANIKYPLNTCVKAGRNVLVIKVKTSDYLHPKVRIHVMKSIVEPIVLTGDFGAYPLPDGKVMLTAIPEVICSGDWGLQGFSGYSGTAVYRQEAELKKDGRQAWLDLGVVNVGAEVFVNGEFAAAVVGRLSITGIDEYLIEGPNIIEVKVKNTLNNLFENYNSHMGDKCSQAPSGILGPARICLYKEIIPESVKS